MNLFTGERYKVLSKDAQKYILGQYGRPAGPIAQELKDKVPGSDDQEMLNKRPGSLLEPGWEKAKLEAKEFAQSDEDVLTYILFPDVAVDYLKKKNLNI